MAEVKTTEEYDGTNWSSGGTATSVGGEFAALAGTQTDAMAVGGYVGSYHGSSESYNGTSWSSEATFPSSQNQHGGSAAGTGQADYIVAGGTGSDTDPDGTYHYDGSSWSSGGNLSNNRHVGCMNGNPSDAIFSQGNRTSDSELYNGSTWSSGPSTSSGRYSPSNSVACSGSANGVVFGGGTGSSVSTGTSLIQEFDE
tara:strand:+ start:443 stop:1036 length:594 start_codon:yes stop_codon:yes gene_type:complete